MTEELDTVFIRHRISCTAGAIEDLYQDDLIAVHYSNTPITADPDECAARYEETGTENHRKLGKKIEVLKDWAESGTLVGAEALFRLADSSRQQTLATTFRRFPVGRGGNASQTPSFGV